MWTASCKRLLQAKSQTHWRSQWHASHYSDSATRRGLLVTAVPQGQSPLKLYDIITEVGREPVNSIAQFDAVTEKQVGKPLLLHVVRMEAGRRTNRLIVWAPQSP